MPLNTWFITTMTGPFLKLYFLLFLFTHTQGVNVIKVNFKEIKTLLIIKKPVELKFVVEEI